MLINLQEYQQLLPVLIVSAGALIALIIEMFYPDSKKVLPLFSVIVFTASALFAVSSLNNRNLLFNGMFAVGGISGLFTFLFSIAAVLVVLSSVKYLKKYGSYFGEYYILIYFTVLGMMLMAGARDLFVVFIGLEIMSVCFYVLAGINRKKTTSNEASLKYFLLGAFATGFIVYGIALVYGSSGTTNIDNIAKNLSSYSGNILFITGLLLLLVGFSFKIAAFPFHMWVPDVYQGSATTVTALMSTAGKSAAFSVLLNLSISSLFADAGNIFGPFFSVMAVLSMLYGSIVALSQNNIKRMLAYSSIAHAGYMLIGFAAGNKDSFAGIVFYLFAYTFMNLGAFSIVSMIEGENDTKLDLDSYIGLSSKKPVMAAMMALFMFALSGLPPFAGFFGKYYVFVAAIKSDMIWLAIIGVFSSLISVYFYLRIIVLMYFKAPDPRLAISNSKLGLLAAFISALFVVVYGLFPGMLMDVISYFI